MFISVSKPKERCKHKRQTINHTYSGKACQNWNNLSVNSMKHFLKTFSEYKEILDTSDVCKDPSNSGIMGCYVNDPVTPWEPCFFSRK